MAGEATASIVGSQAALKVLYPKGELPKSINEMYVLHKRLKKDTDFVGELAVIPIQNANPQGSSAVFSTAQASVWQGNYLRFQLTRKQHYGVARVTGEAAEAAVKSEGAMVDLWDNETKGIATTEMSTLATYLYGIGDGVLGQVASGQATTTVTLAVGTNMNYFELNMSVRSVSAVGYAAAPTVRAVTARITSIDRRNRILTLSAAITGQLVTDWFVRAGDEVTASGTPSVISGLRAVVAGGTAPGTLHQLDRNQDPVRLAGQAIDYSGWATEDAVVDASAQSGFQGIGYPNVLICNNIEAAAMKKSLAGKLVFNRPGSSAANYSFSDVGIEGENGSIEVLSDPFCPRNEAYLLKLDAFSLFSLKAAPHLAKYDGMEFLRLQSEDAYEVRFVFYGNLKCKNPGPHVRLINFGVGA